jgi:hypothetical protein
MNRLVVIASIVCGALTAAACGSSSTGPTDSFTGTWTGSVEGANITLIATQSGSNFTGTGSVVVPPGGAGDTSTVSFNGTSTPPNVNADLTIGSQSGYTFDGTYTTRSQVTGWLHLGPDSAQVTLAKQ